ncbi:MAG: 5'/3'-nucleotidase SurE [Planctomycetes bacterium]|nr:5'/3'-nucleotidase SurE [Planctomycetota bacterium]
MHILLTNDDGILAPGLAAMYRELTKIGQVTVAAPDTVQSASAHAITINTALTACEVHVHNEFHGWSVAGRPADCVKLAVRELAKPLPDLVVSGLNDGANVSINVLYSGTVAAAAEGALLGIPSIAVSMEHGDELDFDRGATIAREIIERCVAQGLKPGRLLNVNIPDLTPGRPLGVKLVPQATQTFEDYYEKHDGPDGAVQYWLKGIFNKPGEVAGTDMRAIWDGYVSVTPLHFDLTDRRTLDDLAGWSWPTFDGHSALGSATAPGSSTGRTQRR